MFDRRPLLRALACGLFGALLLGCGSSSPEVKEAESAFERGDFRTSLENANRALERDSANTDAYLFKAKVLRRLADSNMTPEKYTDFFRRAAAAEDEAIAFDSDLREDVTPRRRRIYDRQMDRGERAYNEAAKYGRERAFRRAIGFFGAAGATLEDSARAPLSEAYARLKVGQRSQVIPVLERYVERADSPAEKPLKILGQLYLTDGQNEAAADLLDRAVALYPEEQELQSLRLNAYNRAGDVDRTLVEYRKQIERSPDEPTYRYNYGALLLKARRYTAAIEQLTRATELRPDDPEGQYNLGAAYLNAALARDDSIAMIEDDPSRLRDSTVTPEQEIDRLAQRRQELFEQAIPPLERARAVVKEDRILRRDQDASIRRDACRALLVAYVQTDRPKKAAQVENCTGFARGAR